MKFVAGAPFWWFHPYHYHTHRFVHGPVVVVPVAPHRMVVRPYPRHSRR